MNPFLTVTLLLSQDFMVSGRLGAGGPVVVLLRKGVSPKGKKPFGIILPA
jgi:hypothetical protein